MSAQVFEIKHYMVIWRQEEVRDFDGVSVKIRGIVRCTGNPVNSEDEYTLDVVFYAPDSAYPQPIYNTSERKGYMFMPISEIMPFVDILRNEKPIFGHLRGDRPEWTSVTTTKEPVGEGEISQDGW
jgi:hypothetical protein